MKHILRQGLVASLLLLAGSTAATAQRRNGFNPDNPPEPHAMFTIRTQTDGLAYSSGGGTFEQGTEITLNTSANSENYTFSHWEKNGEWYSDAQRPTYTVDENATFTAVYDFTPVSPSDPASYNKYRLYLTSNTEDGFSFNRTSGAKVEAGEYVTLEAYPSSSYVFKGWYQDGRLLSKSLRFNYLMPAENTELSIRLVYNPASPGEPGGTEQGDVSNSKMGDINGDGVVNITDAVGLIDRYVANDTTGILSTGDMNGDGVVNITDAVLLVDQYVNGD